jgi:hypothetical protein
MVTLPSAVLPVPVVVLAPVMLGSDRMNPEPPPPPAALGAPAPP